MFNKMDSKYMLIVQNQEMMDYTITDKQKELAAEPDTFESKIFDDGKVMHFSNTYTDAVVVAAIINGYEVHRILVDTGSSVNAIFHHQAKEMGLSLTDYEYSSRILQGFSGERRRPEGEIMLPVCWGEETNHLTYTVRFVILNSASPYNCIFGRPLLNQFDAFVSTKRMMVKIPAPYGIATIRSNISEARQCYMNTWNSYQTAKMTKSLCPPLPPQEIAFAKRTQPVNRNNIQRSRESNNRHRRTKTAELPPLSCSLSYIVALLKQRGLYEKPYMLKVPYEKYNSEAYCSFHEQHGHDTQQCYKLKKLLNRLINEGHLLEFLIKKDKSCTRASTSGTKEKKRRYDLI